MTPSVEARTTSLTAIAFTTTTVTSTRNEGAASLLPAPASLSAVDLGDGMTAVYAMLAQRNDSEMKGGKASALAKGKQSEAARKREADAVAKQEYDASHKSFWEQVKGVATTVGEVAGVVAGVAACVVTGGAAAPLIVAVAAIILSTGGMVVAKTGILGEYSKEIGMGMAIGGTVLSLGSNLAGGLSAASAASTSANAASTAATTTKTVLQTTRTAAELTSAGAHLTSAGASVEVTHFAADEQDALADATKAKQTIQRMQRETDQVLDWLKDVTDSNRTAMKTLHGAIETLQQTQTQATSFGVRA